MNNSFKILCQKCGNDRGNWNFGTFEKPILCKLCYDEENSKKFNINEKKKQRAYFHGKFFDSVEEMIKYADNWYDQEITEDEIEYYCEFLRLNLWPNIEAYKKSITNKKMAQLFEKFFFDIIKEIHKK